MFSLQSTAQHYIPLIDASRAVTQTSQAYDVLWRYQLPSCLVIHAPHNGVFSRRTILENQDETNLYIRGSFVQFEGEQTSCFHLDENVIQALRVSAVSFR